MGGDNGILGLLESPSRHHNLFIYATENKSPNNGDVIRMNVVSPEPPTQSPTHDKVSLQSSSDAIHYTISREDKYCSRTAPMAFY